MDNKKNLATTKVAKANNVVKPKIDIKDIKGEKVSTFKKISKFVSKNFVIIILVSLLICILLFAYFYSDYYRPKNRIKEITNNLTYNKDRERIDFCGDDNYIKDKIRSGVKLDKVENSITFLNPNVNLYDNGLSSEYYINIENTENNDNSSSKYYKVAKVTNYNKLYFQKSDDSESIKENEVKQNNVVVTYFRPSSNQNIYKYKLLTDYYICSSFNSFLVGKHKLDYCDVNMINRALHFGARYIELEVMNKEVKNYTEPIVCSGIEKGNIVTSLNYLMFNDCIRTIASYAFSEKALANFNDPLFLYLNLKTGTNVNTNDRIHDIIVENLRKHLLSSDYNHVNISKLTLCELRRKVVILTNKTCPGSRLDSIITCSSDKPYLKRIKMSDLDRFKKSKTPKLEIISRNVQFNSDLDSYVTIYDEGMDLLKSGVKGGDFIQINNASNPVNNSGLTLNKIKMVNKNMLVFETQGLFVDEKPGAQVVMKIYDESYVSLSKGIEEFNKNNITIIVPDTEFYSKNFDYKRAHYKGCQFVAMNFQNQDKQMEKYFRQFQRRSFQFKPEVLINEIELPKALSLNTMVPKEKTSAKYSIDYNFLANIGKEGFITPFVDSKLRLISDSRDVKFSMSHYPSNSKIMIVKGLDNKGDSVSFKLGDRYLHTNDNCCYLYFSEAPPSYLNTLLKNNFRQNASFIPLKPNFYKKGFNSFGIKKSHIINQEQLEFVYQLRLRNYFTPSRKIYTQQVNKYDVKFEFNLGDGQGFTDSVSNDDVYREKVFISDDETGEGRRMVVLTPSVKVGSEFKPLGDIIVPRLQLNVYKENDEDRGIIEQIQSITTLVYSGAVDKPKDYELIYDNKYFTTKNRPLEKAGIQFSVWKPIPNNGYSAVSVVFSKGYQKPSLNDVVCVSNEFLKEIELNKKPLWFHTKSNLIFWKNNSNYYANVYNSFVNDSETDIPIVPNPIDNLTFDVIRDEKDFSSRIYLDKKKLIEEEDKTSSIFNFMIDEKPESSGFGIYDYLMDIENNKDKIMSYNTSGKSKMCISLPQPYWTNIFDTRGENPAVGANSDLLDFREIIDNYNLIILVEENILNQAYSDPGQIPNRLNIDSLKNKVLTAIANQELDKIVPIFNKYKDDLYEILSPSASNRTQIDRIFDNVPQFVEELRAVSKKLEKYEIEIEQCKGEKYIGTNWNIMEDKTIRLKDYNDYCLTYNAKNLGRVPISGSTNKNSKIFLEKCKQDLKNQQFLLEDGNIKPYNPEANENKHCLHHNKRNKLKVEECGSRKYSLLWKWGKDIRRVDKCSLNEIEKYMEDNVNHIKECKITNYYVVYRDILDETNSVFKYKLFCDYDEAIEKYNDFKKKYSVTALFYQGKIRKKSINGNYSIMNPKLEKYCQGLMSLSKYCQECTYPDRIICRDNSYVKHEYNHTSSPEVLDELVTKCSRLHPNLQKCERDRRQKFITSETNSSFCLQESKEVFIYIFDKEQFSPYNNGELLNINLSRKVLPNDPRIRLTGIQAKLPQRVDNLLAEPIDYENYHLFLRGFLRDANNSKFYRIVFDSEKTGGVNSIYLPKTSYDIFLNMPANYDDLQIGTKVLCNHALPNTNIGYKFMDDNNVEQEINNAYVRWLAVVIEKKENNYVRILLSINSYESDLRRRGISENEKLRPYSTINLDKIVKASELVILKKAPMC